MNFPRCRDGLWDWLRRAKKNDAGNSLAYQEWLTATNRFTFVFLFRRALLSIAGSRTSGLIRGGYLSRSCRPLYAVYAGEPHVLD